MIRPVPLLLLMGCLALAQAGRGRAWQASAQTPQFGATMGGQGAPMAVTTDTPEYCAVLEHRIMEQPSRPAEVRQLMREGHQLCDHGQVRMGISHLRRALVLMKRKPVAGLAAPP
jgi:hypothetical protein